MWQVALEHCMQIVMKDIQNISYDGLLEHIHRGQSIVF